MNSRKRLRMESWVLRSERLEWIEEDMVEIMDNTESRPCIRELEQTLPRTIIDHQHKFNLERMFAPSQKTSAALRIRPHVLELGCLFGQATSPILTFLF